MWQSLRPLFAWCQNSWLGTTISDSTWAFAYIEVFHLLGLTVFLGSLLILSMRMAGLILKSQTVAGVRQEVNPYLWGGLILVTLSGVLQFSSEALKCFDSPPFQYKMALYFAALLFQFTVFRRVAIANENRFNPLAKKATAAICLILWFGVGIAGRAIGFF